MNVCMCHTGLGVRRQVGQRINSRLLCEVDSVLRLKGAVWNHFQMLCTHIFCQVVSWQCLVGAGGMQALPRRSNTSATRECGGCDSHAVLVVACSLGDGLSSVTSSTCVYRLWQTAGRHTHSTCKSVHACLCGRVPQLQY